MENYRYVLDKSSKKFLCPECRRRTFVRYIDTETGQYLPERYGRCDREINCTYFFNPYDDGYAKDQLRIWDSTTRVSMPVNPVSYISPEIMNKSLTCYERNNFIQFLRSKFDFGTVKDLIERYFIGTSNHWKGATIFWQIDQYGNIRTGKIMLFETNSGHRIKKPSNCVYWAHKCVNEPDFNLKQCCFGEHLLSLYQEREVGLVESEKTAIICSVYYPEIIWLATGGLSCLNLEKCKPLAGRKVYLFPDLNGYNLWEKKIKEIAPLIPGSTFVVSNYLEKIATPKQRTQGLDLADFLICSDN